MVQKLRSAPLKLIYLGEFYQLNWPGAVVGAHRTGGPPAHGSGEE